MSLFDDLFNNLRAEMTRHNVTPLMIAQAIGKTVKSVKNKMAGRTNFTISEACAIKEKFFPDMTLDYLFAKGEARRRTRPATSPERS